MDILYEVQVYGSYTIKNVFVNCITSADVSGVLPFGNRCQLPRVAGLALILSPRMYAKTTAKIKTLLTRENNSKKTILPETTTTPFSILNSGVVYFTTVVVYVYIYILYTEEQIRGVRVCVAAVQFHNSGRGGACTRRSENECNSLKDANKQRRSVSCTRRLINTSFLRHPTPWCSSYYCQRILLLLILLLYYILSVLLLLTRRRRRRLCPTCSSRI